MVIVDVWIAGWYDRSAADCDGGVLGAVKCTGGRVERSRAAHRRRYAEDVGRKKQERKMSLCNWHTHRAVGWVWAGRRIGVEAERSLLEESSRWVAVEHTVVERVVEVETMC